MAMAPTRKLYKLRHHSLCQCYLHRKALVNFRNVKWCWHNTATPILLNSLLHDGSNKDKILWNKQIFHFHCLADLASITIITILRTLIWSRSKYFRTTRHKDTNRPRHSIYIFVSAQKFHQHSHKILPSVVHAAVLSATLGWHSHHCPRLPCSSPARSPRERVVEIQCLMKLMKLINFNGIRCEWEVKLWGINLLVPEI